MEQGLGKAQTFSLSHVGARGKRLLAREFSNNVKGNPNASIVYLILNGGNSDYDALQAQFQRRLSRGLQAEAEQEFVRALDLNPKYVQARDWYAFHYLQLAEGRLEEGVAQAKLALEADPLSSYTSAVYGTCCIAGRDEEAVQECERAVELDPESLIARLVACPNLYQGLEPFPLQRDFQPFHNGAGDLVLNRKNIFHVAVISL